MDNLQSFTYETFEKDPVKYRQYEEVGDGPDVIIVKFYLVVGHIPSAFGSLRRISHVRKCYPLKCLAS